MDRRFIIKNAGLAGVLVAGVAPAVVHAQANVRWRLVSSFPKAADAIFGGAEVFAKKVGDMTGGRFQITVHGPGELVPALGTVDAIQNATVEAAHTASYYYFGKDPTFSLGCAIPFGLNARQTTSWMYEGNGLKLTREFYQQFNIISFPCGNTGAQMGGWWRKEIKSLADIKGVKFRTAGIASLVFERLGGVAVSLAGGAIYPELEKGTIDAAEWVGPYDDQKLGLNKLVKYYAYPAYWEGGTQADLHVNTRAYEALSPEYKAIVESAAAYAHVDMLAKYDARNAAALKQLVAGGTTLIRFPKDMMDAAFRESNALYSDLSAKNPAFKKIYDDLVTFRRDVNLWFRFTEAGFDDYMQSARL